jgi:rubrerythrin
MMMKPKTNCVHSCKGLCNALETAEHREREAIKEYTLFLETCDYPDVREILNTLIRHRQEALKTLQEQRAVIAARFHTLDNITDSFA